VECTAIVSAALYEEAQEMKDFKASKLSVYVKKGTDRLRLWLENEELIVQPGDQKPDRYRVSGHQNGFLVAIHLRGLVQYREGCVTEEKLGCARNSHQQLLTISLGTSTVMCKEGRDQVW
jgi:hypothetical protein